MRTGERTGRAKHDAGGIKPPARSRHDRPSRSPPLPHVPPSPSLAAPHFALPRWRAAQPPLRPYPAQPHSRTCARARARTCTPPLGQARASPGGRVAPPGPPARALWRRRAGLPAAAAPPPPSARGRPRLVWSRSFRFDGGHTATRTPLRRRRTSATPISESTAAHVRWYSTIPMVVRRVGVGFWVSPSLRIDSYHDGISDP